MIFFKSKIDELFKMHEFFSNSLTFSKCVYFLVKSVNFSQIPKVFSKFHEIFQIYDVFQIIFMLKFQKINGQRSTFWLANGQPVNCQTRQPWWESELRLAGPAHSAGTWAPAEVDGTTSAV